MNSNTELDEFALAQLRMCRDEIARIRNEHNPDSDTYRQLDMAYEYVNLPLPGDGRIDGSSSSSVED